MGLASFKVRWAGTWAESDSGLWGVNASFLKTTFKLIFNNRFPQLLNSFSMIGNSHVCWRSMTVDYPAADLCLLSPDPCAYTSYSHAGQACSTEVRLPEPSKSTYYFVKSILSKHRHYCQSDFENSKGMPERGLPTIQQFPDCTQYRDSHIHLISARISTPTSFPMVCGLENTNVHVSWSWAAKEKSPPKRQSCMLLVPLKLFTIVQHNVTLTTISHREIVFYSPLMSYNR